MHWSEVNIRRDRREAKTYRNIHASFAIDVQHHFNERTMVMATFAHLVHIRMNHLMQQSFQQVLVVRWLKQFSTQFNYSVFATRTGFFLYRSIPFNRRATIESPLEQQFIGSFKQPLNVNLRIFYFRRRRRFIVVLSADMEEYFEEYIWKNILLNTDCVFFVELTSSKWHIFTLFWQKN